MMMCDVKGRAGKSREHLAGRLCMRMRVVLIVEPGVDVVSLQHPVVEERTDPPDEQGIKKLSTAFPQNSHGGFAPSEFQRTVLEALRFVCVPLG